MTDHRRIAEKIAQQQYLPGDTSKWVECLKKEDIFGLRRLLKKERKNLSNQYKKLYRAPNEKMEILLHFMRVSYPFFTKKEKQRSENFLKLKQREADGKDIYNRKRH